jgi:hypothetical protein
VSLYWLHWTSSSINSTPACVMNLITHNKAYSIYPRATFFERRSLTHLHPTKDFKALLKYENRGWTLVHSFHPKDYASPSSSFAVGPRRLGDKRCWTIDLLPVMDLPRGDIESNTWSFGTAIIRKREVTLYPIHNWILRKIEGRSFLYDNDGERWLQEVMEILERCSPAP